MRRKSADAAPANADDLPPAASPPAPPLRAPPGAPPSFRVQPSKEAQSMSRPPFPAAAPQSTTAHQSGNQARSAQVRPPAERRALVVGKGISVQGTIQDAERLTVEGVVESPRIESQELVIALGGLFRGEAMVEDADIAGVCDGTVTARGTLTIRATGRVIGVARCARLQVEDGGQISGQIEMITDAVVAEPARTDPAA
jgi:cytoskeletal protein CcmA (bactofilin family)